MSTVASEYMGHLSEKLSRIISSVDRVMKAGAFQAGVQLPMLAVDVKRSGAIYLLVPLVIGYIVLGAMPFSELVQEKMMRKFHLSSSTRMEWCVWQLLPSMYNFSNKVEVVSGEVSGSPFALGETIWVNHYPPRLLTYYPMHDLSSTIEVKLHSRYRGAELVSQVELSTMDGTLFLKEQSSHFTSP